MSLSPQTIATVKSTAPVLTEHGQAITALFYQKLFAHHPELKNIFNLANQQKGEQKRALADAVIAYATHIDKLEALGPAVNRIAQKHASLQVKPEHYPIVGQFLLEAIGEHLGLSAEDPVIRAWAEAYQALAVIFVDTEQAIYEQNENKLGGWRGDRAFSIVEIVPETMDVCSFYLKPVDGKPVASWRSGQYVGVKTTPDTSEFTEIRQYSLSNSPNNEIYRITVKAEAKNQTIEGLVSNFLHQAKVGDQVYLRAPTGDFYPVNEDQEKVLLAGGVGITPVLSMLLEQINQAKDMSKVTLIQCARDQEHLIKAAELKTLSQLYGFHYFVVVEQGKGGDHTGYLTSDVLAKWIKNTNTHAYFCGPKPFMTAVNQALQSIGFEASNCHYETFGPSVTLN